MVCLQKTCHHQAPRTLCVNSDHSAVRFTLAGRTRQMFLVRIRYIMLLVECIAKCKQAEDVRTGN